MLGCTLSGQTPFVFALDSAEEAIAVDLAQVKEQGVQLGVLALNFSLELFKGKLDIFLDVEDLFNQPFA